ncbi:hypothetical protein D3C80_915370 [compost metagenome]
MAGSLDHVHQGAEDDDQGGDGQQKHGDLLSAATQGHQQEVRLAQVGRQLEYPEHSQHAHHADDHQVLGIGEDQREDAGQHGQQVDQPVEAEGVAQRFRCAVQAQQVLDREQGGEDPFEQRQLCAVLFADRRNAVEHHHCQAGEDGQQQEFVEAAPGQRIAVEDDHVQAFAQRLRRRTGDHDSVPGQGGVRAVGRRGRSWQAQYRQVSGTCSRGCCTERPGWSDRGVATRHSR